MSQDKLSPQVTVHVPADRNQSAPQDTAPFVVFFLSVTRPVVLFFPSLKSSPFLLKHFQKITSPTVQCLFFCSVSLWHLNCGCLFIYLFFSEHHRVLCKDARNMTELSIKFHI